MTIQSELIEILKAEYNFVFHVFVAQTSIPLLFPFFNQKVEKLNISAIYKANILPFFSESSYSMINLLLKKN